MSFKPASGRKRESDVWKYFTYDAVADKSVCTSCEQKITGKNSTNLKRHLEYRHDDLFKLVSTADSVMKATKSAVTKTSLASATATSTTMDKFVGVSPYAHDSNKYKLKCNLLAKYLVSASIPTRTVENKEFREFCHEADPRFEVPGW